MNRVVFHSENGPSIGGSDYYMGKLIDGLDQSRYTPLLHVRPDYPVSDVVNGPLPRVVGADQKTTIGHDTPHESQGASAGDRLSTKDMLRSVWRRSPRSLRLSLGFRRQASQTRRLILDAGASLFHAMDGGPVAAPIGASRAGVPVVLNYSAPPPTKKAGPLSRYIAHASYRAADVCIAKSHYTARAWREWIGVKEDKFEVVPNGDDFPLISATERLTMRREIGVPGDAIVVGMTGGMIQQKGPLVLLAAAGDILRRCPRAYFVFTGGGNLVEELNNQAARLGIADRVATLGSRENGWRFAAAYDIAVVPSMWDEPFGWVVIEAMAQAVPAVASRVGGIPEIVEEGVDGLLFDRGNATELARHVIDLIESPAQRAKLGDAALEKQHRCYSREAMLGPTYAIYNRLLMLDRDRSHETDPRRLMHA